MAAELAEHVAELGMSLDVVGLEPDGLAIVARRSSRRPTDWSAKAML